MVKWLKYLWSIREKMMHKKVRKLTVTSKMKLKLKLVIMTVNFHSLMLFLQQMLAMSQKKYSCVIVVQTFCEPKAPTIVAPPSHNFC